MDADGKTGGTMSSYYQRIGDISTVTAEHDREQLRSVLTCTDKLYNNAEILEDEQIISPMID